MASANEIIVRRLLKQAEWCGELGSELYAKLLRQAAADVEATGTCWTVLRGHHEDAPGSALALRFLGAVHRLVLEGKAPQLAMCYPSTGGDANCADLWQRFHDVVGEHVATLRELIERPVQTNEVGRCAALLGGFLEVARCTSLPLRLLEIGAAAGLILRWDHHRYEQGNEGWGNPDAPVHIAGAFASGHPSFDVSATVAERRGCDTSPIDPTTQEGKLTLQSYVWPDQVERFQLLEAALEVARRVPANVEKSNAADWIESALGIKTPGTATVVYHSIVWQYLPPKDRDRIERAITTAGREATTQAPLAWLRFEPGEGWADVRLRIWPDGDDRLIGRSGFHGRPVHWLGKTSST